MALAAPRLDLDHFWQENRLSQGKPFRTDKPRAPIALGVDDHWLMQEMELPSSVRYFTDPIYQAEVNRRCNDRCEEFIGLRPFGEKPFERSILRIEEVMGSRRVLVEGGTPWLEAGFSSVEELSSRLDEIERWSDSDLSAVMYSTGATIARRPLNADGSKAVATAGSRGPATQATSIVGTMNAMYWIVDHPAVMARFFEVLADVVIRYHRIVEDAANVQYRGYSWLDDNCALYSPALYREFIAPAMRRIMREFAPLPTDTRYQHSDSAMAHLLPILADFDYSGVNFGPTVTVEEIRAAMPRAVIHGEVAPMTLRDGDWQAVVAEVRRDFDAVGGDGGLVLTTAGSISAGTSLESIRGFMAAVQTYCRYDGQEASAWA